MKEMPKTNLLGFKKKKKVPGQILTLNISLDSSGSLLSWSISCFGENFFVIVWELPWCVNKLNWGFFGSLVLNEQLIGFALGFPRLMF